MPVSLQASSLDVGSKVVFSSTFILTQSRERHRFKVVAGRYRVGRVRYMHKDTERAFNGEGWRQKIFRVEKKAGRDSYVIIVCFVESILTSYLHPTFTAPRCLRSDLDAGYASIRASRRLKPS